MPSLVVATRRGRDFSSGSTYSLISSDFGLTAADLREGGKAYDRWARFASEFQQRALASFKVTQ